MERERFLARLAPGRPDNLPHPLVEIDEVPPVRYSRDLSDPVAAFEEAASRAGATVRRVSEPGELLAEVAFEHGAQTVAVSGDPEVDGIPLGDLEVCEPKDADLGVTGAAWGIAATGSVVVDAARAGGRSVSLLPPVHLAFVHADRILADPGAFYRQLGGDVPSQFVLITGPSRSADIELTLTMGVHGPGAVWIGVLPQRFVPRTVIADTAKHAPRVDADRLREDIDSVVDRSGDG